MAKSRRLDGKPETDADKRFYKERESGYTGPLDQNGRRVPADDPAAKILADLRRRAK